MKSSAVAKTAGRVIDIERGREKLFAKHVQLFIEDLRQQPRHKIKVDSNAAEIRSLDARIVREVERVKVTIEKKDLDENEAA
jgi:hypothetical protein